MERPLVTANLWGWLRPVFRRQHSPIGETHGHMAQNAVAFSLQTLTCLVMAPFPSNLVMQVNLFHLILC